MQTQNSNIVDLGQVRRVKKFSAIVSAPWKASLQLGQIWANYAFGMANLGMQAADMAYRTNMGMMQAFQEAHTSYSMCMDADMFFEHLPINQEDLYNDASIVMGRVLMPSEDDNAPARQLSDYQELKIDIVVPGEKFSIYFGSINGDGARYHFDFDDEYVFLRGAYNVHDFDKKYESLHDVVRETARFTETLLDFMHHIRSGAEQKMRLARKELPMRDLGSGDHLTLVEI